MARKLIGLFEVGGVEGKKPSEMTEAELDAWAEALSGDVLDQLNKMEE